MKLIKLLLISNTVIWYIIIYWLKPFFILPNILKNTGTHFITLIKGWRHEAEQTLRVRQKRRSVDGIHHNGPTCVNRIARYV
jgi:hypothetical protein